MKLLTVLTICSEILFRNPKKEILHMTLRNNSESGLWHKHIGAQTGSTDLIV
jgi:hypothetical protein